MEFKSISLVLPCYKQERTIKKSLLRIEEVLKKLPHKYEIIVYVDGDIDKTRKIVERIAKKNKKIKVMGEKENHGKGYAVKQGMLKATGDIIGFMDADLNLDPSGLEILINFMKLHKAHIVVGSKLHPDSEVNYPFPRKLMSFVYRWMTQFLFGLAVLDTQAGMKIFRKRVAKDVFPRLLVKQFAFDIEVLALANALGYHKIYEAPIKLKFKPGNISAKNFIAVVFHMIWDTLAVFYRIKILRYYRKSNRKNWLT